jgi:hypothetical protein
VRWRRKRNRLARWSFNRNSVNSLVKIWVCDHMNLIFEFLSESTTLPESIYTP